MPEATIQHRTPRTPIGMPFGRQGTVVHIATARRGIPSQFSRDRRWRAIQAPGDCADTTAASTQQRDLLSLDERQVTTGQRSPAEAGHTATVAEPSCTDYRRDTPQRCGVLTRQALGVPFATPAQKRCWSSRRATSGRLGEYIRSRTVRSDCGRFGPGTASHVQLLTCLNPVNAPAPRTGNSCSAMPRARASADQGRAGTVRIRIGGRLSPI